MGQDDFARQLTAMVQAGSLLTRRAEVVMLAVTRAHVTDSDALASIARAVGAGELSEDDLRVLRERAPMFVDVLLSGLRPLLGPIAETRLASLVRHGHITASVMDRALCNVLRAKAA